MRDLVLLLCLKHQNVFTGMTVEENLEMGGFLRQDNILEMLLKKFINYFPVLKRKKKSTQLVSYPVVNVSKLLLEEH